MKAFMLVVLCLLVPAASIAADADTTATGRPNSLRAGAWAVQFSVNGYLSSGTVLFKHHFARHHAVRFGLTMDAGATAEDYSLDTTRTIATGRYENDYLSARVEATVVRYANPDASAHFYYGVGPYFEYAQSHYETVFEEEVTRSRTRDYDAYEVGGMVLLGGEWFASRAMSLHVEYMASLGYESYDDEFVYHWEGQGADNRERVEGDRWVFDAGSVRFGLGFYF